MIETLRDSGISFEVPDSPKTLRHVVIIDREFLQVFGTPDAEEVIVVEDPEDVVELIHRVLGVEEKSTLIGVDVGARIAYVVIRGNFIIGYGKVGEVSEFKQTIKSIIADRGRTACHARVGVPASPKLREVAYEVSRTLLELGCEVRLTEEFRSSSEHPPPLIGVERIRDSDIRAAINLALR